MCKLALEATYAIEEEKKWKDMKSITKMLQISHIVIDKITPVSLMKKIDEMDDFILVDIREPGQKKHGDILADESIEIVRGYLEFKIENFIEDKSMPIIVYCCSGKRSILAANVLKLMGYKDVRSLEGGIQAWVEDGLPLDTHYGEMIFKQKESPSQSK
jgi:rhodanese-related sulfurtransferase